MSKFEIRSHPQTGRTEVVVDGFDLSQHITDLDLNMNGYEPPRITVELRIVEDVAVSGEAHLVMSSATANLLRAWGWISPVGKGVTDD